ncbi:MAG: maleylpyruvate isomerase family mycothiol-dependent enzyme [Acidimicrobiia bacterium]|nr:maleylpyruvate isomerase family mycothiol-dependent enzyme [Acidimicrobiia bacterium]
MASHGGNDPQLDREIDLDVDAATAAHRRLLAHLDVLVSEGDLAVESPSRLPGWSRGHVLAHLRQSGDGHLRLLEAAARGEVGVQYPNGVAGRAADIEEGSILPMTEQVDLLRASSTVLEAGWIVSDWEGEGDGPAGRVSIADLPFMREREVVVHHIDLDIGYEFDDLPIEYLRLELRRMEVLWTARQRSGVTQLPDAALRTPPPTRLAWLIGRVQIDGLEPAGIF